MNKLQPNLRFKEFNDEYQEYKIEDIFLKNKPSKILAKESITNGQYPFLTGKKDILKINKFNSNEPSIFICNGGNPNITLYKNKCSYSSHMIKIIVKEKNSIDYLYLNLKNKEKNILTFLFKGSTLKMLSQKDFFNYKIKIPSLPEQQKIANFFTLLDSQIEHANNLMETLQTRKNYLLQEMFCNQNQIQPNFRFKEFNDEYKKHLLKNNFNISRGSALTKNEMKGNNFPVYSSKTTGNGVIGYRDVYDFDDEYVLWTTDGVNAGFVFYKNERFSATSHCGLIHKKDEKDFSLKYLFLNLSTKLKFEKSESAQPMVSQTSVKNLKVSIPSLPEQQKIANFFTLLDRQIEHADNLMETLQTRKNYLMQEMFI